ncbi:MAG: hypothetical protein DSZ10_03270 [Sulfurovum sp.]|nr:MAG: hypothetical protein DSZ10_03270 [Sulfurovum sp.]
MIINLFQTAQYRALMQEHLLKTITYLFEKEAEFAIACQTDSIIYDPPLPKEILDSFQDTVLFILSGYTYQSATVNEHILTFEAGFGEENYGSRVTVPLLAIRQVFVGENPILLNMAYPAPDTKFNEKETKRESKIQKNSMEALLKNPENKKLLKKKK